MLDYINISVSVLQFTLLLLVVPSIVYVAVFAIASKFYVQKRSSVQAFNKYKVSILIPAYKEDQVIFESAVSASKHYSKYADLEIVVIADKLQQATIQKLQQLQIKLVEVNFEKSTKAKALNFALQQISPKHNYCIVLDADNIMADGFVDKILMVMAHGYQAVQGHRTAKNNNSQIAILDGFSEEINNSIFRKGHRSLGLSSSLIGSGFACDATLFRSLMSKMQATGGFDKELELALIRKSTIGYAEDAIVYDEKVQDSQNFIQQRRRWISAQYIFLAKNIKTAFSELIIRKNVDYFDKVMQFLVLPRMLLLGLTAIFCVLNTAIFFLFPSVYSPVYFALWTISLAFLLVGLAVSLPNNVFNKYLAKAALAIPYGFMLMLIALLRSRNANKTFIHTTHGIKQKAEKMT